MISPSAPARGPMRDPEASEPPGSTAPVAELLRLISKAARAHQLYLPNNPIYRRAIDNLRAGFGPVWDEVSELKLTIGESEIRWFDTPVAGEPGNKSSDNLAWLFYKDGVRELTFNKGFEEAEVVPFLGLIQRARKGSPDEDDLVTMLWEADFAFVHYGYVDLLQEGGVGELADGGELQPVGAGEVVQGTHDAVQEAQASGFVNIADFDSTLYFLDEREIEYLHAELKREYEKDLRVRVASVLLDIFESQPDPEVRAEALENIHTLMVYLLTAEDFSGVAYVLREGQVTIGRAEGVTDQHRQKLGELAERLSAADALSQLLQSLDETPTLPPEADLAELFDQLRPTALATVFLWLSKTQNDRLRPLLQSAAGRIAGANTSELVRLIGAPQPEVATEAVRLAGALKTQAAVAGLGKLLTNSDVHLRQVAAHALAEIGSPGAMQALERAIDDDDRDVRVTAVRAMTARNYRPALSRLESVVKGKRVREADLTEKMAFFEGYGSLCGEGGVSHLDAVLNGKGFLGRREDSEIRACAAIALGRVGTPKAIETLRKAATEKDIVVRNAVSRALRGPGSHES
ncbi:MAG TPA: HEAT repeat domain-containing protein [Gemmatimonadaceae bacterium]|nr:HEAT repeat domain-containing protein [Gemmatimonadaceae bacterium]